MMTTSLLILTPLFSAGGKARRHVQVVFWIMKAPPFGPGGATDVRHDHGMIDFWPPGYISCFAGTIGIVSLSRRRKTEQGRESSNHSTRLQLAAMLRRCSGELDALNNNLLYYLVLHVAIIMSKVAATCHQ
mmetsp:Transcript_16444/g.27802  ORF Transcript_16444/g.27802 Transcript_16444/m.27802 type:complete len:131 (+) Transcript_16444:639-1031(+)